MVIAQVAGLPRGKHTILLNEGLFDLGGGVQADQAARDRVE